MSWEAVTGMLVSLVAERGGYGGVRTWFGQTPYASDNAEAYKIAQAIGYDVKPDSGAFVLLTRDQALASLSFLAADSLVMPGGKVASQEVLAAIEGAFERLGPTAQFYSNGDWHDYLSSTSFGWHSISEATFDGGVIGFSNEVGFLFWVEEED